MQTGIQKPQPFLLKDLDRRIARLEEGGKKSLLKKISENAGLVALFLGLVLTLASLRDVFVTKPETDRINALSQFNKAVSSAALIRQELFQLQTQVKDPAIQLAMQSAAMPRILNEISTARAILPDLKDSDVGIPQLMLLTYEALNVGDPAAIEFVRRAVQKTDAPPFLRSEAKRTEARYLFMNAKASEARRSFAEALDLLGQTAYSAAPRAWDLLDWISFEFTMGDCAVAETQLARFAELVRGPGISPEQRQQLTSSLLSSLSHAEGLHCPRPQNIGMLANP